MSKNTVEDFRKTISIKNFKENGFLDGEYKKGKTTWYYADKEIGSMGIEIVKNNFSGYLRVFFIQTNFEGNKKEFDYKIGLVTTKCNYGGVRRWFLCPCKGNRCSILYLQENGYFASRKTLDLCYGSQKESKRQRTLGLFFGDEIIKILEIREKMKYPFRNGKPTRKLKKIIKLQKKLPTKKDLEKLNQFFRF